MARILERCLRADRPLGRTELQYAVRLNTRVFTKYVAWMTLKGYLQQTPVDAGVPRICATERGAAIYKDLARWLSDTLGDERR